MTGTSLMHLRVGVTIGLYSGVGIGNITEPACNLLNDHPQKLDLAASPASGYSLLNGARGREDPGKLLAND